MSEDSKGKSFGVNRRIYDVLAKRKRKQSEELIYKTLLRKRKIDKHVLTKTGLTG